MPTYTYTVIGTAADGQTWEASGEAKSANAGAFMEMLDFAMRSAFMKLTSGKAVYGKPGVGCRGPYTVTHLELDLKPEET
jgi:hypothetical protein